MADFYQTGAVTTLHRLTSNRVDRLEADLEKYLTAPAKFLPGTTKTIVGISDAKSARTSSRR